MDLDILSIYGNRVRVRACGLCVQNDSLLMINHSGITSGNFWAPPGGGVEFGETIQEALVKEFKEETGINVMIGEFKFGCEFIKAPLHSIELFFAVEYQEGEIKKGFDPEMPPEMQIIQAAKWMAFEEINRMPDSDLHGLFKLCHPSQEILKLRGFWRI